MATWLTFTRNHRLALRADLHLLYRAGCTYLVPDAHLASIWRARAAVQAAPRRRRPVDAPLPASARQWAA